MLLLRPQGSVAVNVTVITVQALVVMLFQLFDQRKEVQSLATASAFAESQDAMVVFGFYQS